MFSYVDQKIRRQMESSGKLIYLDIEGNKVDFNSETETVISLLGPIPMPRMVKGHEIVFNWYAFVKRVELNQVLETASKVKSGEQEMFRQLIQERMSVNSILSTQNFAELDNPLVRIHSCCMTGDVFGSMRCECGPQLELAFERIGADGGAVVYMSGHEGRGIGLFAKAMTYILQDQGQDTYEANLSLGLPEDSRDFRDAAIVLKYLTANKPVRLMSNNPIKKKQIEQYGQKVLKMETHIKGISCHNERYVKTKGSKGHLIPEYAFKKESSKG
ncbi:MAG: GTP cyclohydrolase II [Deltaproteobacteria bacterium]|nr:GTP cyclohydrolase II [Deltaproteobacteria bacterium]